MSDIRHDPIDDLWVAMADNRRERPMEFIPVEQIRKQIICPFCKGNEQETPAAVAAYSDRGTPLNGDDWHTSDQWTCRVVNNKYPSFSTREAQSNDARPSGNEFSPTNGHLTSSIHAPGIQELIIPSPRHVSSLSELIDEELETSFVAQRDRLQAFRQLDFVKHGMLFMNCRSAAGASLGHIHWQLIGTPLVSDNLKRRCQRNQVSRDQRGQSIIRTLLDWELEQDKRVLRKTDHFVMMCPFASRFPLQVRIIPLDPGTPFVELDEAPRNELAWLCRDVVLRLEDLLDKPAYNILLHGPPFEIDNTDDWYVEIFPRLTTAAGFELGTDVWVNPVTPETAARALRAAV
ncbi:MAG: DUF4921 family protein [Planctomycetota bacterium]